MGVKYSAQESQELIQAMTNNLQVANEVTDRLSSGCDHLISSLDSGELSGAAYTAGKGLFTDIIIPSIKKLQAAVDDIQLELTSYKYADAQVSGYGDLDLDQLKELKKLREEQLAIVEAQIQVRENWLNQITDLFSLNWGKAFSEKTILYNTKSQIESGIQDLDDKIEKLEFFVSQVSQYFNDSLEVLSLAIKGTTQLSKVIVDSDGNYYADGVDMSWVQKMKDVKIVSHKLDKDISVTQAEKDKKKIVDDLVSSYNLDESTANVLYKLQQGILKKAKQEGWTNEKVIYEYNRLVASFVPDNFLALRYKAIAGVVELEERDELSKEYGLSSTEIKLLAIKLPEQHNDSTSHKDYAHEAIQLAAFTEQSWSLNSYSIAHAMSEVGNTARINIPGSTASLPYPMERYEISFKGDVDSGRYGDTDFNSDIDPINSYDLMKNVNQKDIFKSQADYNQKIESNTINRVEEFYKNLGKGNTKIGKDIVRYIVTDGNTIGSMYITQGQSNEEIRKNQEAFFDYLERGEETNVR